MTSDRLHARRRAAERRGRRGEFVAALLLVCKGYRIIGRRVRTRAGEIDIIARTPDGIVCFVEVKVRDTLPGALEALLPRQQARIARAAELYLAQRRSVAPTGVRFDTIMLSGRRWPQHLRDSWRPDAS
jgi:putative endonuclease